MAEQLSVPPPYALAIADDDREPIWVGESVVDFADPRMVAELDLIVGGLRFPEPGEYRVQVYAANEFVIERRLLVNRLER